MITRLRELKDTKERKNEEIKALNAEISQVEAELITSMQADGIDSTRIDGVGTCYITTEDYPQVKDMNALVKWAADNNMPEMIQKRVSNVAFKDYVAEYNMFPDGIDTFVKETVHLRRS